MVLLSKGPLTFEKVDTMNKYHQQSSPQTAAITIVAVLMIVVVLLAGCVLVGLMFYRNTTHKAAVARQHALQAEAQARKAAEMERQRAEEMARAAEQKAQAVAAGETGAVATSPKAELDIVELQIVVDADGHLSVDGERVDWEQVNGRIRQISNRPSSRVVIFADEQGRMEPVLKLLQAAEECKVEATISTSPFESKDTK